MKEPSRDRTQNNVTRKLIWVVAQPKNFLKETKYEEHEVKERVGTRWQAKLGKRLWENPRTAKSGRNQRAWAPEGLQSQAGFPQAGAVGMEMAWVLSPWFNLPKMESIPPPNNTTLPSWLPPFLVQSMLCCWASYFEVLFGTFLPLDLPIHSRHKC